MSDKPNECIIDITRINCEPGDVLYIRLPKDTPKEQQKNIGYNLNQFFEERKIRVLIGDIDLQFQAVAEASTPSSLAIEGEE